MQTVRLKWVDSLPAHISMVHPVTESN